MGTPDLADQLASMSVETVLDSATTLDFEGAFAVASEAEHSVTVTFEAQ